MRDLFYFTLLAVAMVYTLRKPWIGIMSWTIVSIMSPHVFGNRIRTFPVAMVVAAVTLIAFMAIRDKDRKFPMCRETATFMMLMLWISITLPFSFDVEGSFEGWKKVMKIDFMILIALAMLRTKHHIEVLVWMLAISIGFYGVKGGIFTITSGGNDRVWGPESTFIEGNNELALAIIMVIPFIRYLQMRSQSRWLKLALLGSMLISVASALGSHSRGALLALATMAAVLWMRSRNKFTTLLIGVIVGTAFYSLMPAHWFNRMETIGEYQQDGSAMGRINAWWMAYNLAKSRFFGGGFNVYNPTMFGLYAPDPTDIHAAHSIYFQILGEHGFVGLFIFLLLWFFCWRSATDLRKRGSKSPETQWVADLGAMCQVSMAGYFVGGAFLSLAYFDLPYNTMILIVLARAWLDRKGWLEEQAAQAAEQAKLDAALAAGKKPRKNWLRWTWGQP